MKKNACQYTIRGVPCRVDAKLRETAAQYGASVNRTALQALARGLGLEGVPPVHHDLDDLAGTWVPDAACEDALEKMDRVDTEMWA